MVTYLCFKEYMLSLPRCTHKSSEKWRLLKLSLLLHYYSFLKFNWLCTKGSNWVQQCSYILVLLDYKKRLLELFPPAARALSLASLRSHDLASASLLWGEKLAGNEKCSSRHYRSPVLYGQEKRNSWVQSAKKDKRKTIVNNPRARCVNKMVNHNYDVTN